MKFIAKYSPEITIKSRSVRMRFIRQLARNLNAQLRGVRSTTVHGRDIAGDMPGGEQAQFPSETAADSFAVEALWDHIEVTVPGSTSILAASAAEVLANTPGIHSYAAVAKYPLGDFDSILTQALRAYAERLRGKRFAVRCKRSGRHDFSSVDVERWVGAGLIRDSEATGVDLGKPEVVVQLEIRDQDLFVVEQYHQGLGGFPVGTQDGVLSLISGGFDSAVSSFLAMRRGMKTHFCFFNLGGREHEIAVKELALYLWMKFGANLKVKFVTVPFEGVVAEIMEKVENSQMGVVLKRMMLRAASQIARDMHLEALVTGESVAQVSSQTLANLAIIEEVTEVLVLRPLAMADKQEIIDLARRIGTEEFSAHIPEYCGVISVKPTTRARRHRIAEEEANFDFGVLDQAVRARRVRRMHHMDPEGEIRDIELALHATVPAGSVVLDIRHPDEEELRPLALRGVEVRKIPFYRLATAFKDLDPASNYLLYCDKGLMSRLHANHLLREGHANVAVYRP